MFHGRMIGGFALSRIRPNTAIRVMTFIVNHAGIVFRRIWARYDKAGRANDIIQSRPDGKDSTDLVQ
jgi:hypothetical protein